jgi:hypothetical protein
MRNPEATALQKIVRPRFQGSLGNRSQEFAAMRRRRKGPLKQ